MITAAAVSSQELSIPSTVAPFLVWVVTTPVTFDDPARSLRYTGKATSDLSAIKAYGPLRRAIRYLGLGAVVLLIVVAFLSVLLLYPVVQTGIAQWASVRLSKDLGIDLRVERVELRPFGPLRLHGLFVADLQGDTLVHVQRLDLTDVRYSSRSRTLRVGALSLSNGRFALRTVPGGTRSNLTELLDHVLGTDTTSSGSDASVLCGSFELDGLHFSFHDPHVEPARFGVDFSHIDIPDARVRGKGLAVRGDSIIADLEQLTLHERSGLRLERFQGQVHVSPRRISVDELHLLTAETELLGRLQFTTTGWSDYNEFMGRVDMRVDLDTSRVSFGDIALFATELEGIDLPVRVSGRFRGTVSDLKARGLDLRYGARSRFRGNADLIGLPALASTFLLVDADEVVTDHVDLATIPVPPFTEGGRLSVPQEVARLGTIRFAGNFTGFPNAFTAYGSTRTQVGDLRTDLSFERDTLGGMLVLSGRLASDRFDVGRVIEEGPLGPVTSDIRVNASGTGLADMKAEIQGDLPMITINGYEATGISLNALLEEDLFIGELHSRDRNLVLDFQGKADLRGHAPVVDFEADLQHADLVALNLIDSAGYSSLNVRVIANAILDPDSGRGTIDLQGISYCDAFADHELGDLLLSRERSMGRDRTRVRSDLADIDVDGDLLPTRIWPALQSVVFSVFPALRDEVDYEQAEQAFDLEVRTKDTRALFDLFAPDLTLSENTVFNGRFDSRTFDIALSGIAPFVEWDGVSVDSLRFSLDKTMDVLAFAVEGHRGSLSPGTFVNGVFLSGKAYQDEVDLRLGWTGSSHGTSGDLRMNGVVHGPERFEVDLLPSDLFLGRGNWRNERTASFLVDSSSVRIKGLHLANGAQQVRVEGEINEDPTIPLAFELQGLRLENLRPWLDGPGLHGSVSGQGRAFDPYGAPYVLSELRVDSLSVGTKPVGDLAFAATWNEGQRAIDVNGSLERGGVKAMDFEGAVNPGSEQELDIRLLFDRFDLAFLEPYMPEGLSGIQGALTGDLSLNGTLAHPAVRGTASLVDAGIHIDYLGTSYSFSHDVNIAPDMFALDLVELHDEEGNSATAIATILHDGLRNWNYNVSLEMDRFLCMETGPDDNELYFGKAYARGTVEVSGYADKLEVTLDAVSERGTDISFPLGASTEVSNIDFVRFVSQGVDSLLAQEEVDLSGVELDMHVSVTPDARFQLIFDPTVGDIMSGRGAGELDMTVTPAGEFSMRGDLEVTEGEYLFTLRNILNKRFEMAPGGRIVWYGDPLDAQLDLSAIYRLRAPLYNVMVEQNDAYRKRVPVEVTMHLTDKLQNPGISYEVRLPTVDEDVRSRVNAVMSTPQDLNRQVFSLIVLNNFTPPPDASSQGDGLAGGNYASTTASELLSNQVSNWLSGLSKDVDLGLNYRPGDAISQEEVELAVSTQLFNERLLLNTTVGVQYGQATSSTQSQLIGDVQAEYLLSPDGKLRLKAYNLSNDQNLNRADQAQYTQGVGVGYRREFDRFFDLFRRRSGRKGDQAVP